jgi:hypothetical protein
VIYRFFKFQKTLDGDDIITFDFLHTYIHHPHTATCLAHLSFLTCTHSRYNLPAALCTFLFLRAGSFSDSLFFVAEGTGNNAPIKALFSWTGSNPKGGLIHAGNKWIPLLPLIPFGGLIPSGFNPSPLFGWQGSIVGRQQKTELEACSSNYISLLSIKL